MKNQILCVIFLTFLFICGKTDVFACQCAAFTPKERVKVMKKQADAIFVGKVKSISEEPDKLNGITINKVTLMIEKSWKSGEGAEIVVYIPKTECSFLFSEGKSFLVYAKKTENFPLFIENCSGSNEVSFVDKDLKYLGKPIYQKSL